ncbi:MAG: helix-turn-helix transcriptional regulator [Nannocystaceae bacterium]|nr:YafY family transcriptional regulator [bacterium]
MIVASARLLRLLALLQARGFWTGAELSDRLEVTPRTVRRDVDRLRSLGYPIRSSTGVAGGYQLGAGASVPPLLLEDDEAQAVALSLRTAATGTVSGLEEAAVRALAKLEQMMPARLRRRVHALRSLAPLVLDGQRVDATLLSAVAAACRNLERASFRYADAQGVRTRRRVEPHGVVFTGRRWYLAAWDETREDWRTFRIDRITGPIRTGSRFPPRPIPHGDVSRYVAHSITSMPHPIRVSVILHAPLAEIEARTPGLGRRLQPVDEHRCRLTMEAAHLAHAAITVVVSGAEFEVESPPELRDELRATARRIRRSLRVR